MKKNFLNLILYAPGKLSNFIYDKEKDGEKNYTVYTIGIIAVMTALFLGFEDKSNFKQIIDVLLLSVLTFLFFVFLCKFIKYLCDNCTEHSIVIFINILVSILLLIFFCLNLMFFTIEKIVSLEYYFLNALIGFMGDRITYLASFIFRLDITPIFLLALIITIVIFKKSTASEETQETSCSMQNYIIKKGLLKLNKGELEIEGGYLELKFTSEADVAKDSNGTEVKNEENKTQTNGK